jgi:hypothetical protein
MKSRFLDGYDNWVRRSLATLDVQRKTVESQLAEMSTSTKVITLHPASVRRYLAAVERLTDLIHKGDSDELHTLVRDLIAKVSVHTSGESARLNIEGPLDSLMGNNDGTRRRDTRNKHIWQFSRKRAKEAREISLSGQNVVLKGYCLSWSSVVRQVDDNGRE